MEQSEPGVVFYIIRHRDNLMTQAYDFFDGPESNARRGLLVHGMDHDVLIVKGQEPAGLVAMSQKATRDGLTDDERDYRMSPHASLRVSSCGCGRCQEDRRRLFAAPIRLTLYVHDGDNRAPLFTRFQCNRFANAVRESIGFLQSDLAFARAGKASFGVRYHAKKTCRLLAQLGICRQERARIPLERSITSSHCVKPCPAANARLRAHVASPCSRALFQFSLTIQGSNCSETSNSAMRLR